MRALNMTDERFRILMHMSYEAVIEDIHVRTQRVLQYHYGTKQIYKPFVPPSLWGHPITLPGDKFNRIFGREVWKRREELLQKEYERDIARLADLIPIVKELEEWLFAEKEDAQQSAVDEFLGPSKKTVKIPVAKAGRLG